DQIEFVPVLDVVRAAPLDAHAGEALERALGRRQRAIVDVDGEPAGRPVRHRPIGVAPHAAADVQEGQSAPILRLQMRGPAANLLLVFGADLGIVVPFVAEPVGRAGGIGGARLVGLWNAAGDSHYLLATSRIDTPNGTCSIGARAVSMENTPSMMRLTSGELI